MPYKPRELYCFTWISTAIVTDTRAMALLSLLIFVYTEMKKLFGKRSKVKYRHLVETDVEMAAAQNPHQGGRSNSLMGYVISEKLGQLPDKHAVVQKEIERLDSNQRISPTASSASASTTTSETEDSNPLATKV